MSPNRRVLTSYPFREGQAWPTSSVCATSPAKALGIVRPWDTTWEGQPGYRKDSSMTGLKV